MSLDVLTIHPIGCDDCGDGLWAGNCDACGRLTCNCCGNACGCPGPAAADEAEPPLESAA